MQQNLEQNLYDKTYTCPICSKSFKSREIRTGKTKFIEVTLGLRAIYTPIMPDYYSVIICDDCGYASLSKTFNKVNAVQKRNIQKNVSKDYKPKKYPSVYDAKIAIDRYKIALYFAHIKDSDISEKAYISQKIAFIYEDVKNNKQALQYFKYAYNWYNKSYVEEDFPIMDMEEPQFLYNLAYLAYKIDNKDEAKKTLSRVIAIRNISNTLKEKIKDFTTLLRKEKK